MRLIFIAFPALVWGAMLACCSPSSSAASLTNVDIIWAAPTNHWPETLWIYKVVPQKFSPVVISNLTAMSGFSMKDRTNMLDQPPFDDESILYFRNADQSKHLGIFPKLGFIDYDDRNAAASSQLQPVVGVPGQDETTRLGLKYLRQFGIDISQIVTKPDSCELFLHWERRTIEYRDEKTGNQVTLTNLCGVKFNRRIDGIPVKGRIGGMGGVDISFGNYSKIVDLQICWRNLEPYELRQCASPAHIMDWIKSGRTALPLQTEATQQVRKITVVEALPLYDGKFPDEEQEFVAPFVNLGVAIDNGKTTNIVYVKSEIHFTMEQRK